MKNSIAIAGALVLLLLITMRIGVQGSPIAGIYGEDEGIPLTLLRQRRQAGSCRTNSDCNEWNPCCSKYGYCGTKDSGHCDRGTEDGGPISGGSGGSGGGLGAKCTDAYDCNERNPCCAGVGAAVDEDQWGTCGTDASGHCGGAVTIDPGQDVPLAGYFTPCPPPGCEDCPCSDAFGRVSSRRRASAGGECRPSVFDALGWGRC